MPATRLNKALLYRLRNPKQGRSSNPSIKPVDIRNVADRDMSLAPNKDTRKQITTKFNLALIGNYSFYDTVTTGRLQTISPS